MKKAYEIFEEGGRKIIKGLGNAKNENISKLRDIVDFAKKSYGKKTAFQYKKEGKIEKKTYIDFASDMDALGTALLQRKMKGKRIAIIAENRYEWCVAYMAIVNGTGVVVPLDKHLPQAEIENLILRSGCEGIVYSEIYKETMAKIATRFKGIKLFICMDKTDGKKNVKFVDMPDLLDEGRRLLEKGNTKFTKAKIDTKEMSVLLFTSGTTKLSKAVMLSHKNIATNLNSCRSVLIMGKHDVHLSLLPLHHTFENTVGFLYMFYSGVCISYCEGIKHIVQNLKEFKVTVLVAVPAIFEAVYGRLQDGIKKAGKEKLINSLQATANGLLKVKIDLRRQIMAPLRNQFAPHLRLAAVGAAPMTKDIMDAFEGMGIRFLQGYGLTETSPLVCATDPQKDMAGYIGYPVNGVKVSLDNPDENGMGEIIVKGDNVTSGYFENEEETKEAFTSDGWFKTGDLAVVGEDNALKITGRVKSMIVFPNGKKAFPEEYENLLNKNECVKESFVWGFKTKDGDVEICAKIVLQDKNSHNDAVESIANTIKDINSNIPQYKIIRYFVTTKEELVKTTTLKIKRPVEEKKMNEYLEKQGKDMRKVNKTNID